MSTNAETQPVVVGVDGSPTMFLAVAWAVDYASSTSAPLRIVVVYHQTPWRTNSSLPAPRQTVHTRAHCALPSSTPTRQSAHARALDPMFTSRAQPSRAPQPRSCWRRRQRSALMVLGSPQLGRLHRAFTGSTGAAMSARAVCPVVVVRKQVSRSLSGTRVVVGIGGPASQTAAEFAFQEARRTHAGLTAVKRLAPQHRRPWLARVTGRATPEAGGRSSSHAR